MVKAAAEKFWAWCRGTALPWLGETADDWVGDVAAKPRSHAVSMVAALLIYLSIAVLW